MDNNKTSDSKEYGDFQTPLFLCDDICNLIKGLNIDPSIVIEPTCGKGSFLLSSLKHFSKLTKLIGIEINQLYYLEALQSVLKYYISKPVNSSNNQLLIHLLNEDIFNFNIERITQSIQDNNSTVIILGNPPWVTNSYLSVLDSNNTPTKSNLKKYTGLDAITGKSNFDISESIVLLCFDILHSLIKRGYNNLYLGLLLKDSVIKNIVYDLPRSNHKLKWMKTYPIDTKSYFSANTSASLFLCKMSKIKETPLSCSVYKSLREHTTPERHFGWHKDKFAFNITLYRKSKQYDGYCPFQWRQGIKHDCSKVMVLKRDDGGLINGLGDKPDIERTLIYPLVKGSMLNQDVIRETDTYVIVTQKKIGQDTSYIKRYSPKLYNYLESNRHLFDKRKSKIYKNNPAYSIFGVGEYSFKPYKVAVSGFSKKPHFSLILTVENKSIMLDDTSYFLGFDELHEAIIIYTLLNSFEVRDLLSSIVFINSKRPFTKSILMRIDLPSIINNYSYQKIIKELNILKPSLSQYLTKNLWEEFNKKIIRISQF
jgi:hypothetical protein